MNFHSFNENTRLRQTETSTSAEYSCCAYIFRLVSLCSFIKSSTGEGAMIASQWIANAHTRRARSSLFPSGPCARFTFRHFLQIEFTRFLGISSSVSIKWQQKSFPRNIYIFELFVFSMKFIRFHRNKILRRHFKWNINNATQKIAK